MKYLKAILSLASVGLLLYTVYEQNNAINRLKGELLKVKEELFQVQSQNGRLELGLDHLKEVDSSKFNLIEEFINHETE